MGQSGAQPKCGNIIDENLRRVYEETVDEGVPDRFRVLLDALKQQDQNKCSGK